MPRFEQRRNRLRRLVRKTKADAMLVTDVTNVTYLTGFTGDSSYLLLTQNDAIVISDTRYTQQLEEECPQLEVDIRRSGVEIVERVKVIAAEAKVRQLAFESHAVSVAEHARLADALSSTSLVPTQGLTESLREVKDREEIREIREAIDIAQRAFSVIRASLRAEQTEKEIAYALENQIRLFGGTGCSFTPIIAVGPRGALPHAPPTGHQIGESDFVLMDWGAHGGLYVSDLTRILVTGRISPKLERIYAVVLKAQLAGIAAIKPGAVMADVDAAARKVIEDAGYGKRFGHGLGHGFGLQVHESVRLASNQQRKLKAGMVLTVEPGIYLPGWGGVRIEDDILVTRTGHEVLSTVPKQLSDCIVP